MNWLLVLVVVLGFIVFVLGSMCASCCLLGRCCRRAQYRRGEHPDEEEPQG